MANRNFVVRQGTVKIIDIAPTNTELLGITDEGLVVTTGIASGAIGNLETEVNEISAAISALVSASSGAIATINGQEPENLNINLVTQTDEVSIAPGPEAGEVSINVDLSDYATIALVEGVSGTLNDSILSLESDVEALSAAIDGIEDSTVISSSGGSILVTQDGNLWNLEVASAPIQNHNDLDGLQGGTTSQYYHLTESQYNNYIGATEVDLISSGLDGRITDLEEDVTELQTDVQFLSGAIDEIEIVGVDGISVVESPDRTWTVSVTGDFVESDDLNDYVLKSGDTMSGDLTINGNLYVNGTEFVVNTETVSASDNLIVINAGEVGAGVTKGFAGIQVDRGSVDDYYFMFRESDETFVIGISGDLQAVATREDVPTAGGYAVWNDTLNRFDTVPSSTIASEISGTFVNRSGDTMTGDLTVQADIIIDDGSLVIDGSTQAYAENLTVNSGIEIIDQFDEALGTSASWLVSVRRTDAGDEALRTSMVVAAWYDNEIDWYETSTNDIIGNTEDLTLTVILTTGEVRLVSNNVTSAGTWEVKAHRTLI